MALFRFAGKARCAGRPGWPFKRRNAVRRDGTGHPRAAFGDCSAALQVLDDKTISPCNPLLAEQPPNAV